MKFTNLLLIISLLFACSENEPLTVTKPPTNDPSTSTDSTKQTSETLVDSVKENNKDTIPELPLDSTIDQHSTDTIASKPKVKEYIKPMTFYDTTSSQLLNYGAYNIEWVTFIDMDGDNDCDILYLSSYGFTGSGTNYRFSWLKNDGSGNIIASITTHASSLYYSEGNFKIGDYENDGDLDFSYSHANYDGNLGKDFTIINNNTFFVTEEILSTDFKEIPIKMTADFNGDGIDDSLSFGSSLITLHSETGEKLLTAGIFDDPISFYDDLPPYYETYHLISYVDITGSGMNDIIYQSKKDLKAEINEHAILFHKNNGNYLLNHTYIPIPKPEKKYSFGDFDNNGVYELYEITDTFNLYSYNNGTIVKINTPEISSENVTIHGHSLFDIDGDSDKDMVILVSKEKDTTSTIVIMRNNQGNFTRESYMVPKKYYNIKCGMFNQQDSSTILLADYDNFDLYKITSDSLEFLQNSKLSVFIDSKKNNVIDINQDGLTDIIEWDGTDGITVYFNKGSYSFDKQIIDTRSEYWYIEDVDLDGDYDFWAAKALLLNDGSGNFTNVSFKYDFPFVKVGDFDNNGTIDGLFLSSPSELSWYGTILDL